MHSKRGEKGLMFPCYKQFWGALVEKFAIALYIIDVIVLKKMLLHM